MRITRRNLRSLVENFLREEAGSKYICPNCGKHHKGAEITRLKKDKKCLGCQHPLGKKKQGRSWGTPPPGAKSESIFRSLYERAKKIACPAPTQSVALNTANRDRAIQADFIEYGFYCLPNGINYKKCC